MPVISVIVPVYNVESYLRRCVDSILNQTFTDFELILVDDGSPDNCPAICDEYAQKDSRVHVIHQENRGQSTARNIALNWVYAHSDSQWLTFIDSDDWVHPQMLELLYDNAINDETKISMCRHVEVFSSEVEYVSDFPHVLSTPETTWITEASICSPWDKLYHKTCFENIRFADGLIHEDELLIYRVIFSVPMISILKAPLYFYFQNPNGTMGATWSARRMTALKALEEQLWFFEKNNYLLAYQKTCCRYMRMLADYCRQVRASDDPAIREEYEKMLTNQLRKQIRKYGNLLDMNNAADEWVLGTAYPTTTRLLSYVRATKNRLCGK